MNGNWFFWKIDFRLNLFSVFRSRVFSLIRSFAHENSPPHIILSWLVFVSKLALSIDLVFKKKKFRVLSNFAAFLFCIACGAKLCVRYAVGQLLFIRIGWFVRSRNTETVVNINMFFNYVPKKMETCQVQRIFLNQKNKIFASFQLLFMVKLDHEI